MSVLGMRARNHPQQVATNGARDEVDDRGTDPRFYAPLHERFRFTLDVAAAPHNAKCERHYTRHDNGLEMPWGPSERVWCNPPYSDLKAWVVKAWREWGLQTIDMDGWTTKPELIVMLVPANRPEQAWWQDYVEPFRDRAGSPLRVEFPRGRVRFTEPGEDAIRPNARPHFPCCLLIWEDADTTTGSSARFAPTDVSGRTGRGQ